MNSEDLNILRKQYHQAEIFPVVDRYPADLITPLGAYLSLSKDSTDSFLFESIEGGEALARYSFLGANPVNVFGDTPESTSFEKLRNILDKGAMACVSGLPSFTGGVVGYFDFATVKEFEPILNNSGTKGKTKPSSRFMLFKQIVAFDHAKQELMIVSLVFKSDSQDESQFVSLLETASRQNRKIASKIILNIPARPEFESAQPGEKPHSNWEKSDFLTAVRKIKESIRAGNVYQVVLSQCFSKNVTVGPVPIYRALRSLNPSPYMFLLRNGSKSLVGASPEMLLRCRGNRLEYRPIAGTRPRHDDQIEDERLAVEMAADKKEVAEHTMLVDLGRNDLGRVAIYGSVSVRDLMSIEKFSHVQHLVTYLSASLRSDFDRFDAFASCFPAGTVTGAPKIEAIKTIFELEPTPRGVYSGAVGYFDYDGNLDTCIAIRTLVLEDGVARVQAGAGIVADSNPESEYDESVQKAAGLFKAIELAENGKYGL